MVEKNPLPSQGLGQVEEVSVRVLCCMLCLEEQIMPMMINAKKNGRDRVVLRNLEIDRYQNVKRLSDDYFSILKSGGD